MTTYIVTVPGDPDPVSHLIETDAPPTIDDGRGLTFTLGGQVQAPSPFPQWCSCAEQP